MNKKILVVLAVILAVVVMALTWSSFAPKGSEPTTQQPDANQNTQLANPASVNCVEKGGFLRIVKRGDGGEYGICFFEDNRQCEEWALMRGDCPVGGLKITGYATEAAQYCVITGGTYTIIDGQADPETGTCAFPDGSSCDVWNYYNGGLCGK